MRVVYEPKGRAGEYAPLACNLYSGCAHGCRYCYAPLVLRRDRAGFHARVAPRPGVLEALKKDARKLAGDERPVLLCFTADPYQPMDGDLQTTREAIKILNDHDLGVHILTKGGRRAERDFDLLAGHPRNAFGVTLTFTTLDSSEFWEPRAARPQERIAALREARRRGVKTWVSLEPVIDPAAALRLIEMTHEFVDHFKVGKLNYRPEAPLIDWARFRVEAESLLKSLGKSYYLKRDLIETAGGKR